MMVGGRCIASALWLAMVLPCVQVLPSCGPAKPPALCFSAPWSGGIQVQRPSCRPREAVTKAAARGSVGGLRLWRSLAVDVRLRRRGLSPLFLTEGGGGGGGGGGEGEGAGGAGRGAGGASDEDAKIKQFYDKAAALLAESGGQLDSLQFGRKWKVAFPQDDLEQYRSEKGTVAQLLAMSPRFKIVGRKQSSVKTFTVVRSNSTDWQAGKQPTRGASPPPSKPPGGDTPKVAGTDRGGGAEGEGRAGRGAEDVEERQSARGYKFSVVNLNASAYSGSPRARAERSGSRAMELDDDDWGDDDDTLSDADAEPQPASPAPARARTPAPGTPPPRSQGAAATAGLIDAWASAGALGEAEGAEEVSYRAMEAAGAAGAVPDAVQFTRVIQEQARAAAGGDRRALERAFRVLDDMRRAGLQPTLMTYTALISACAKSAGAGHGVYAVDRGMQALQAMQAEGVRPDVVTYNVLLDTCAKAASAGDEFGVERGFRLLNMLMDAGLQPTIITFNTLLHTCAKSSSPENPKAMRAAAELMATMRATDVRPDIVSYNALVDACARGGAGGLQRALSVLDDMRASGLTPDIVTFNSLVNACARAAGLRDESAFTTAMQVLKKMQASGVDANVVTFNSLMTIVARAAAAGDIPDAGAALSQGTQVIGMMLSENLAPNIVTFNALVTAIVKAGLQSGEDCEDEVRGAFVLMEQANIQPNSVTFVLAMDWFVAQNLTTVEAGLRTIDLLESAGLEPDSSAYKTLIDGCVRSGRGVRTVLPVLERMLAAQCVPPTGTFNSLLAIYARPGEGGTDAAFDMLSFMRRADVELNDATFTALTSVRAADEASGAKKPAGAPHPFPDRWEEDYSHLSDGDPSEEEDEANIIGDPSELPDWITIEEGDPRELMQKYNPFFKGGGPAPPWRDPSNPFTTTRMPPPASGKAGAIIFGDPGGPESEEGGDDGGEGDDDDGGFPEDTERDFEA